MNYPLYKNVKIDRAVNVKRMFKELRWTKNFIQKVMMAFYLNYTNQQEMLSPAMQRFMGCVRDRFGDDVPQWLRDEFRTKNKPLMKYTNMLTFNTRVIALFISLFLHRPWIYFVFGSIFYRFGIGIKLNLTFLDSVIIIAITSLIANIMFFAPMQLGTREGGFLLAFQGISMSSGLGIYVGLITRIRETFWILVGLLLMYAGAGSKKENSI